MILMTASEKVGVLFSIFISLFNDEALSLFEKAMAVQQKYESFPMSPCGNEIGKSETINPESVLNIFPQRQSCHFYKDQTKDNKTPFPRTPESVEMILGTLCRNDNTFILGIAMYKLQVEYLLTGCWQASMGILV
jgi:hypothetical protein